MKKALFYLQIILSCIFAISCNSDDLDNESGNSKKLIGTWYHQYSYYEDDEYGDEKEMCNEPGECYIIFTSTTLTFICEDDVFNGKAVEYKVKGNTLWLMGVECAKFQISGNMLMLNYGDEQSYYKKK